MATARVVQIGGQRFGSTHRTDAWWLEPAVTVAVLLSFVAYATWSGLQGEHYFYGSYLSPFYAPVLFTKLGVPGSAPLEIAWFGEWPSWWPSLLPASPAVLILAIPVSFRFTCYYYRKAYYRSFAATPPGCAVGSIPQSKYRGETNLLIFQNLHRYALYLAIAFFFILSYDAFVSFFYAGKLGVGVGSIVLTLNALLIGSYTFGCHSWRHLVGGKLDCFSCDGVSQARHGAWKFTTWLNQRHKHFAWASLIWVGVSDLYVRLVSMGVVRDLNTWGI